MPTQEEVQQNYVLYQLLQNRVEEIKQQMALVQAKMAEFEGTKMALETLKKSSKDSEALIPLGSGCYTESRIPPSGSILTDLGAGVVAKKDMASAQEFVEKREKEMQEAFGILQMELIEIVNKMNEISTELQKVIQEQQKPADGTGTAG